MDRAVVLVVPCYNEEERLELDRYLEFAARNLDVGFLFVNDGSTDATETVLTKGVEANPDSMDLLSLPTNMGKGEAVRRGLLEASKWGAEVVGYWDADLSTPLEELEGMMETLNANAHHIGVLGSRVKLLGRAIERNPLRHYVGRVFATAASLVLDLPVYDTQCGAKIFRVTPDLKRILDRPFRSRWIFDVELLARLRVVLGEETERRVPEYPVNTWRDVGGSKVRPKDLVIAAKDLVGIWSRRGKREKEYQEGTH
jgi:dolichyl-phosphate beta-glucosyltransferase